EPRHARCADERRVRGGSVVRARAAATIAFATLCAGFVAVGVRTATPAGAVPLNAAVFSCVHGDTYTPSQTYNVPGGITQLRVTVIGAAAGADEFARARVELGSA